MQDACGRLNPYVHRSIVPGYRMWEERRVNQYDANGNHRKGSEGGMGNEDGITHLSTIPNLPEDIGEGGYTAAHRNEGDLRNLNLSHNYLFSKVMEDRDLCRRVLEEILQVSILRVVRLETENSRRVLPESKGIRMDVYVNDDAGTVYNVEMQNGDNDNLPRRSRYYQDTIDLDLISQGEDYIALNRSIVIFICTFPLFGMDRHIYTFVNTCREYQNLELDDGTMKIFLSTRGKLDDVSSGLREFLKYVENTTDEFAGKTDSCLVKDLHRRVQDIRDTRKYQVEYMTLYQYEKDIERKARAEGLAAGRKEGQQHANRNTVLRMHARGLSDADIADFVGISERQVSTWVNNEICTGE